MDNQILEFIEKLNLYKAIKESVLKNFERNNKNIIDDKRLSRLLELSPDTLDMLA